MNPKCKTRFQCTSGRLVGLPGAMTALNALGNSRLGKWLGARRPHSGAPSPVIHVGMPLLFLFL